MAGVTWASAGLGFGNDGSLVIALTMPMVLHFVLRDFVERKEGFATRVCDFVALVSDFAVRVTERCCDVDERRPGVEDSGSQSGR